MPAMTQRPGWLQRRNPILAIALAGVVLGLVVEDIGMGWLQPAWIPIADIGIGWLMIGCGLLGAWARPGQPAGARLVLAALPGSSVPRWARKRGRAAAHGRLRLVATTTSSLPLARAVGSQALGRWGGPLGRAVGRDGGALLRQTVARLILAARKCVARTLVDPQQAMSVVLWLDVVRAASVVLAGVLMVIRLARSPAPNGASSPRCSRLGRWRRSRAGTAPAMRCSPSGSCQISMPSSTPCCSPGRST